MIWAALGVRPQKMRVSYDSICSGTSIVFWGSVMWLEKEEVESIQRPSEKWRSFGWVLARCPRASLERTGCGMAGLGDEI